jgi:hypothetical protein
MSRFVTFLAGFGIAAAGVAAPVRAAQPPATAADNAISIPFAPPLGTILVYRSTQSRNRNGQPETVTLDIRVTFARDADGYIMTVASDLPSGMPSGQIATILQRPFSVRLTRDGELIGLADEDRFWAELDRVMAVILRGLPDAAGRRAVETMMARVRALPHDELVALLCERVAVIFALAGHDLPEGEVAMPDDERESVLGRMTMQTRMISEVRADGMAQVTLITTVPRDQLSGLGANLQRDFAPARTRNAPLRLTSYEERSISLISRRTGLAESWTSTRSMTSEENGATRSAVVTQELRLVH